MEDGPIEVDGQKFVEAPVGMNWIIQQFEKDLREAKWWEYRKKKHARKGLKQWKALQRFSDFVAKATPEERKLINEKLKETFPPT